MSQLQLTDALIDANWLHQHIDNPQLVVFDASWHMPAAGRNGREEWHSEQIKNAAFFDFDERICDPDSDLPHMMPDAELFTDEVQKLGLNQTSLLVIYDSLGIVTSTRAWCMMNAMGFDNCAILDGGLPAWKRAGYDVFTSAQSDTRKRGNFVANPQQGHFCDASAVLNASQGGKQTIIDARSVERFRGEVEEPRAGLRKGHMPAARNLPFSDLLTQGLMKPGFELEQIFAEISPHSNPIICSCGSGVTACIVAFAAKRAGYQDVVVYDGSWCEWGRPGDLPVTTDNSA